MKIGIIFAMERELRLIAGLLENTTERSIGLFTYTEGKFNGNEVVVMQCGIGKVNAALGAQELIRNYAPDCVVSSGVAGGIDERLHVMDVVVSSAIVYHDMWCGGDNDRGQVQGLPTYFYGDDTLLRCAKGLNCGTMIHAGLICSGDQFVDDAEGLYTIKENFPEGLAVDMESGAIAQTCYLYGVPFVSFRIISDTPGVDNNTEQYENFFDEMVDSSFACTKAFMLSLPKSLF